MMTKIRLIKEKVKKCRQTCTELELNGYIDGELNSIEQGFVLESAMQSAKVRARLNELAQLRELVRISYTQI